MRILIELAEQDIVALDRLARESNSSRAQVIRDALASFLSAKNHGPGADAFGLWKARNVDGLEYQSKLRSEW